MDNSEIEIDEIFQALSRKELDEIYQEAASIDKEMENNTKCKI